MKRYSLLVLGFFPAIAQVGWPSYPPYQMLAHAQMSVHFSAPLSVSRRNMMSSGLALGSMAIIPGPPPCIVRSSKLARSRVEVLVVAMASLSSSASVR